MNTTSENDSIFERDQDGFFQYDLVNEDGIETTMYCNCDDPVECKNSTLEKVQELRKEKIKNLRIKYYSILQIFNKQKLNLENCFLKEKLNCENSEQIEIIQSSFTNELNNLRSAALNKIEVIKKECNEINLDFKYLYL